MASRRWVFTIQLEDMPETAETVMSEWDTTKMNYVLYQIERAPTTGQLHAQGVVALSTSSRMPAVKKMMKNNKVHLEVTRNWEKAKEYCRKQETKVQELETVEWGEDKTQGQRSDLDTVAKLVIEGKQLKEIAAAFPSTFIRTHKGLGALHQVLHKPQHILRKVGLFYGATETGKTRTVFECLDNVYTVFDLKNPWFDGYQGEANVLMDECGPGMMNHNFLKRLLDRYPMVVPIKGGSTNWNASTIVMTSNVEIDEWYRDLTVSDLNALKRRVRLFEFPRDKELATAWLKRALVEPEKRDRELIDVSE